MSISLPMIECSSCGRVLGHLYEEYYAQGMFLAGLVENLITIEEYQQFAAKDYSGELGEGWTNFLQPYFKWLSELPAEEFSEHVKYMFTPHNLVARALLHPHSLGPRKSFPINIRDKNGQYLLTETKYCCLRMFKCDNSRATY